MWREDLMSPLNILSKKGCHSWFLCFRANYTSILLLTGSAREISTQKTTGQRIHSMHTDTTQESSEYPLYINHKVFVIHLSWLRSKLNTKITNKSQNSKRRCQQVSAFNLKHIKNLTSEVTYKGKVIKQFRWLHMHTEVTCKAQEIKAQLATVQAASESGF